MTISPPFHRLLSGIYALFLAGIVLFGPAYAAAPIPPAKTEALDQLKDKLESEKNRQNDLKKKMSSASNDLEKSRKDMIALGRDLQSSEGVLTTLEQKITELESEESTLASKLESDYGSMGNLILGLVRIRRMPAETLIIRPGAPLETAQSALLLRSILPSIGTRTKQLSTDIERLQTLHKALEEDQVKAVAANEKLKTQKKEMQSLLGKREKLYRQTRSQYDVQAESVARIAAEAKSLQQLIDRIERQKQMDDENKITRAPPLPGGAWRLPVQGKLAVRFGESDEIGAKSQGIKIAGRADALVTAPTSGIVRFAGPFRNYGNLVIIEHGNDFHSLISGLSRIDTAAGRKISAGEPLGSLSGSGATHPPRLYYELRRNGKPVDPATKFPGLT